MPEPEPQTSPTVLSDQARLTSRGNLWPWLALGLAVSVNVLPHLVQRICLGSWNFVADGDGLLYQAWSREALLDGSPWMVDGVRPGRTPMMHPWLLFVPPALLAHAFGLGPTGLGILWRLISGSLLVFGFHAVIRTRVKEPRLAWCVALFLLFDPGLLFGQLIQHNAEIIGSLVRGQHTLFRTVPVLMPHLRVVTPSFAIVVLLAHYAAVLRAVSPDRTDSKPPWKAIACGAITLGILFHIYFYFWTMVVLGAGLTVLLERSGRRTYGTVLVPGCILGLPSLLLNWSIKASTTPDWLFRTSKFVPIPAWSELLWPKILSIEWILLGFWIWRSRRDLAYLWCCVGAGLLLLNHQVVTRMQIENDHFIFGYGTSFSLLLALTASGSLDARTRSQSVTARRSTRTWPVVLALLVVQVGLGFAWRVLESSRSEETLRIATVDRQLQDDAIVIPDQAKVAGDSEALFILAARSRVFPLWSRLVEFSSTTTDRELDERLVLNFFLEGLDREAARTRVNQPPGTLSWEALATRDRVVAENQRQHRLELIESIWNKPGPWLSRFQVTHLLRRTGSKYPLPPLAGRWERRGLSYELYVLRN